MFHYSCNSISYWFHSNSTLYSVNHGYFQVDQISKMEMCIIKTLRWYLNPPTPFMYLNISSPLIDDSADDDDKSTSIRELSMYLIELSVCDGYFIDKKPSCIAYAAILVAMSILSVPQKKCLHYQQLEFSPQTTDLCIKRLHRVYSLALPQLDEEGNTSSRGGPSPTNVFRSPDRQ